MHANEKVKYKRIFAAVDVESETSHGTIDALNRQILQIASALSLSEFAELHIVHVWTSWGESFLNTPPFQPAEAPEVSEWVEQTRVGEEDTMKGLMATLTEVLNQETMDFIKPQLHIIKGTAQTVIRDLIQEQQGDLLVMGTVARTGISGVIMGNTAEGILENVDCSVLVIKPPDL
jgi:nucleotide-binding universal stress UspA family protein